MKIVPIKCPNCNGNLTIEEGRTELFCQYCGSKLQVDSDNKTITTTNVIVDEARIKEAEVEVRRIEAELEKECLKSDKARKILLFLALFFIGAGAFLYMEQRNLVYTIYEMTGWMLSWNTKFHALPLSLGGIILLFLLITIKRKK